MAIVEREKAWQRVLDVMASVHAKQPPSDKTPLEQEEEIAEMVKAFRRDHAHDRP